jgi:capsular polysaccharide biosynthesis protein
MQLSDYLTVLRRRWWVIMLVAAAASVGAYVFSKLQTPVFRSEASYLVVPNRVDNGLSIVLQNQMESFKVMALAPIQLEQISQQLQLDRDADWLLGYVRIQSQTDTRLMIVQADYPNDPAMAQRLADAVGNNMVALVSSLNQGIEGTDRISMRVNQPARPAIRYRPQTQINVAAGAVLGLILGLLLAFALEALDDSLKSPADVERFVGLTTLGAIPTVPEH